MEATDLVINHGSVMNDGGFILFNLFLHLCRSFGSFLKKIITYCISLLVLTSYNFKTISHYVKTAAASMVMADDYDCEDQQPESKTPDEKNDKKYCSEYDLPFRSDADHTDDKLSFVHHTKQLYISPGFSLGVYSPPDLA